MKLGSLTSLTWLVCACVVMPLAAQTPVPSTEKMIEQLKAPRTRSLRNLSVEEVPAQSGPAATQALASPSQTDSSASQAAARPEKVADPDSTLQ